MASGLQTAVRFTCMCAHVRMCVHMYEGVCLRWNMNVYAMSCVGTLHLWHVGFVEPIGTLEVVIVASHMGLKTNWK